MHHKQADNHFFRIFITLAAFVIVVAGVKAASQILVPFLLAAFIAIITGPFMFALTRRGMPRTLAMVIIIVVIVAVIWFAGLIGFTLRRFAADIT